MLKTVEDQLLDNRWDDAAAAGKSESELLLYRSNILGSDKRVTNYGGGNTSAKVMEKDPLTGDEVEVLWVKGSGGDIGSIKMDGFATLYMEKLEALKGLYRGVEFEDEMVGYLPHCTFNLNSRAASIDTPLHAYVPRKHVDHVHADAIIAIAASKNSKELTQEIFGDKIGWLPWKKPGYELGLWRNKFCVENPDADGVVLESHGLFTWADTAKDCYDMTIEVINTATKWLAEKSASVPAFGGAKYEALAPDARREVAAKLMPAIRGFVSGNQHMVGHFNDSDAVLEFVNAVDMEPLAARGTSCPDHFLRTKIRPLVVEFDPSKGISRRLRGLLRALQARQFAGHPRPQRGGLPGAGRRHDHLRQGQGDGADLGRILCQRDQRDARGVLGQRICGPARAGGLRHRILAPGRGQAAADAQAEIAGRPDRSGHRWRRRDRRGHGRAVSFGRRLRDAGRYQC